jgi:hypothetical protein
MMQRTLLLSVALVCAFAMHGYGEECNLEIRDGFAAQDLSRILHCFDQRIKNLETGETGKRPGRSETSRNPSAFDADTFVLSIRSISRAGNAIQLGMSIRNKTTEEIRVAIDQNESHVLIDEEKGTPLRMQSSSGIKLASSQSSEASFTPIPSNAVLHFSLQFAAGEVKSGLFSFNLYLLIRGDQQVKKITVPLSVTLKG